MQRYKAEENERADAQAEQDQWEAEQMRKTRLKVRARAHTPGGVWGPQERAGHGGSKHRCIGVEVVAQTC